MNFSLQQYLFLLLRQNLAQILEKTCKSFLETGDSCAIMQFSPLECAVHSLRS